MNGLTLSPEALGAVQQFRTFYRDLFDIKQCIEEQRWGDISASPSPDSVSVPAEARGRAIFARMYRAIAGQGFGLRGRDRGNGAPVDVGYVMAAIADEVLLHGPTWPGQEAWSATLLEEALYGTRIAGERIFRAAHDLLAGQSSRQSIAVSILLALMLGFRGRYHGTDDRGEIAALEERLFGVIFHLPYPVQIDFQTLLSQGATRPLEQASRRPLPSVRPWVMAILLLITVYIVLSDALWREAVSPILATAQSIIRTSAELTQ
jgi:type VI secretion system protein ImpK